MARQNRWIKLDQADISEPKHDDVGQIKVQVMVSPSDVPVAVRGSRRDENKFAIEFKYLTSAEKTSTEYPAEGCEIRIGRNSRKIYEIILDTSDVDRLTNKIALEMLVKAEETFQPNRKPLVNLKNTGVIKNFLISNLHKREPVVG